MLQLDPELKPMFEAFAEQTVELPKPERGDWQSRREAGAAATAQLISALPVFDDVSVVEYNAVSADGTVIPLRWYQREGSTSKAAIVYTHGGGKIAGSLEMYEPVCKMYAAQADVGVLLVDFRLAPEHPHPAPTEDCYAALLWLAEHADERGVDLARIGIVGDSGGGGIAAGVALMARDRQGPAIAQQLLVYPMLDDRNTIEDPALAPFATWTYDDNYTGWHAFVGDDIGSDAVSPYAAPSRESNLTGLPATFIDVGELDIFRDESIDYALRLIKAGTSVELHVYPGAPHGFDLFCFDTEFSRNAWKVRMRAVKTLNS